MAQKIFPRSLRSSKGLSQDYCFYSEQAYASLWSKGYEWMNQILSFSQKNLLYKRKKKSGFQKKPNKRKKFPQFLTARIGLFHKVGYIQTSPILFKFAHKSLAKKYNPLKTTHKVRRLGKKKGFQKPFSSISKAKKSLKKV